MVASLWGSVGTGTKEDESSTGRVWAAGFHHVTARSRLARVLKLMKRFISLIFQILSGRGKPRIRASACKFKDDCDMQAIVTRWLIAQSTDRNQAGTEELVS